MSLRPGKCCEKKEKVWKTGVDQSLIDLKSDVLTLELNLNKIDVEGLNDVLRNAIVSVSEISNSSTLNLVFRRRNNEETFLPLTVVDEFTSGVMNPAIYNGIIKNTRDIETLMNFSYFFIDESNELNESMTSAEITTLFYMRYPEFELRDAIQFQRADGTYAVQYSKLMDTWYARSITSITNFSLGIPGVITGSDRYGQLYAEIDGTGTVIGMDELTARVTTLENNKVDKTTQVNKIYATNTLGNQTLLNFSTDTNTNHIVQRSTSGNIQVPLNPTEDNYAASKDYVDEQKITILDEVQPRIDVLESNVADLEIRVTNVETKRYAHHFSFYNNVAENIHYVTTTIINDSPTQITNISEAINYIRNYTGTTTTSQIMASGSYALSNGRVIVGSIRGGTTDAIYVIGVTLAGNYYGQNMIASNFTSVNDRVIRIM